MATCRTENPGNTKEDDVISHPDFTLVSTIPDERTGKSTSKGDLAKIQRKDDFIIKILRNRVVKIHFNSYHNKCMVESMRMVLEAGFKLWSGRALLSD